MKHILEYNTFKYNSLNEETKYPITKDSPYTTNEFHKIEYGKSSIIVMLCLFKFDCGLRVDFESEETIKRDKIMNDIIENGFEDDFIDESLSNDQIALFNKINEIVENFYHIHDVKYIFFQAKKTRENIYLKLLNNLEETKNFNVLKFKEDRMQEGKLWFFLINKKDHTADLEDEIRFKWRKTADDMLKMEKYMLRR